MDNGTALDNGSALDDGTEMDSGTLLLLRSLSENYTLPGTLASYSECNNGHINDTYRVRMDGGGSSSSEYIFQRINGYAFKDPVKVMQNIKVITLHTQSKKTAGDCEIISFYDNRLGRNYTLVGGDYWRVCRFVENSVAFETVEDSCVLYSAGYAFGRFQQMFADLPMDLLSETIPGFHNTRQRMDDFFATVTLDPLGRVADLKYEIDFFDRHRSLASSLVDMVDQGELPLRVTHNDTKYNNILMDKDTCEPLCIIDLDTVMPGLAMYDFGDAIRFAANTAQEDETDLSKVSLNMEYYREFTRGFMTACAGFLTEKEIGNMALGAIIITMELASRFLADHINGDRYFRIHRPGQNLDRARCQIRLAEDMLMKYDEMRGAVLEFC